jgi:hypothetical protein
MSTKDICKFFFTLTSESESHNTFKCRCDTLRRIKKDSSGYSNLIQHLIAKHPNYKEQYDAAVNSKEGSINGFLMKCQKTCAIMGWMDWIIDQNLPFSFVEKETSRKYSNLPPVSRETIKDYILKASKAVQEVIKSELPMEFGLVFDDWTDGSSHYCAIFATYLKNGVVENPLLGFSPLLDETSLTAACHADYIVSILQQYDCSLDRLQFLVGDNCSTNKLLSTILNVEMIGCASHRLNLACKKVLKSQKVTIDKIHNLMTGFSSLKCAGKLRTLTKLKPIRQNTTRWTSTMCMIERFNQLRPFIEEMLLFEKKLSKFMPSMSELIKLQEMATKLNFLKLATLEIQKENTNLLDVRVAFDTILEEFSDKDIEFYLSPNAQIIKFPDFENGIVKIMSGNQSVMTENEIKACSKFKVLDCVPCESARNLNSFESAIKKRKLQVVLAKKEYMDLSYILATSNIVERLFSTCKYVISDHRKSLLPKTSEAIIMLKANRKFWNYELVKKLVKEKNG